VNVFRDAPRWVLPAVLSWIGMILFTGAAVALWFFAAIPYGPDWLGVLAVALMVTGAPLSLVVLFVPVEGPYWKEDTRRAEVLAGLAETLAELAEYRKHHEAAGQDSQAGKPPIR